MFVIKFNNNLNKKYLVNNNRDLFIVKNLIKIFVIKKIKIQIYKRKINLYNISIIIHIYLKLDKYFRTKKPEMYFIIHQFNLYFLLKKQQETSA